MPLVPFPLPQFLLLYISKNVDPALYRLLSLRTYIHSCAFAPPPPRLTLALSIQAMPTLKMMIVVSYTFLMVGPEHSFCLHMLILCGEEKSTSWSLLHLPPHLFSPVSFSLMLQCHRLISSFSLHFWIQLSVSYIGALLFFEIRFQLHFTLALETLALDRGP